MDEILFWNKLNSAYASFCVDTLKSSKHAYEGLVSTMVGEELEWCNTEALVSMTALHGLLQRRVPDIEHTLKDTEKQLLYERETCSSLRKQIKMLQLSAEDTTWELQEQLAHATNTLQIERDSADEMKALLDGTQAKLVEVELYLSSERGSVTLQLEEELAAANMRIAKLEAEKDDLEIEVRRKVNSSNRIALVTKANSNVMHQGQQSNTSLHLPKGQTNVLKENLSKKLY